MTKILRLQRQKQKLNRAFVAVAVFLVVGGLGLLWMPTAAKGFVADSNTETLGAAAFEN